MESYIEISFLHNVMSIILSTILGEYSAAQPLSLRRILIYSCMISFCSTFAWFPNAYMLMVLLEGVSFFFFFHYAYKTYICSLIIRYLFYATAFLLYGGGFHNGVWFVPMHYEFLYLWMVYAFLFLLLYVKWKDIFAKISYVYEINIFINAKKWKLKGYLDSGNLITYKGVPILFVDKKYHEYLKNERIELIVINSVTSTDILRCYECVVKMAGCKKHKVYIHAERHLQLPFQCVVLLNMKMMTMG